MMDRRRSRSGVCAGLGGSVLLGVMIVVSGAAPARACSLPPPVELREALGEVPPNPELWRDGFRFPAVVSVYEDGAIASAPGVLVKSGETVRGVIRYWGSPPSGIETTSRTGGAWNLSPLRGDDSCDPIDAETTTIWVEFEDGSALRLAEVTAADEARLAVSVGDEVTVDRSFLEVAKLTASLWGSRVAALGILGAAGAMPWWLWRRRKRVRSA